MMKKRWISLVLTLAMVLGLIPGTALAADTENSVTVTVQFDYRSVATDEILSASEIAFPTDQTVTVENGSTLYDVMVAASKQGNFNVQYTTGLDGTPNGYIQGIGDIGNIESLCDNLGITYDSLFQYAGWTYTGEHITGNGIQSDKITQDDTIKFRYTVYSGSTSSSDWSNFDGPFVDAYYGLQDDIATAKALQKTDYTDDQWQTLQGTIQSAESTLTTIDPDSVLSSGFVLNYIADKGTSLWGPDSPTDQLQKAQAELSRAVRKIPSPTDIQVPTDTIEIPLNSTYQIAASVLPEGAPQGVTYEAFLGDDSYSVSNSGLITPKKETGGSICMIKIASTEKPSTFAYFKFKVTAATPVSTDTDALLTNISNSYRDATSDWPVMDMGAYALAYPNGAKLSDSAKQTYINQAILSVANKTAGIADYAKAILALSANGIDPTDLTLIDGTKINAVEKMKSTEWDSSTNPYFIYNAPYILLAYKQGDWDTDTQEQALIDYILGLQKEDGSWDTSYGYDGIGIAMQGLAPYYGKNKKVTASLDKAVDYLRTHISNDGLFPNPYDATFAAAEVALGLCAVGVDPATIKNANSGTSLKDGILLKANSDNTGFTYGSSTNALTTERCFRALIAMSKLSDTVKSYNVYDFTSVSKTTGAKVSWEACPVDVHAIPEDATVEVKQDANTVTAKANTLYDLPAGTYTYTVSKSGYTTKTGEFTVTDEDVANHTAKTISVSLVSSSSGGSSSGNKKVSVTVKVMVPPSDTSKAYTYKHNASSYTDLITKNNTISLPSGSTARDALVTVLDSNGLSYHEQSNGYFTKIGDLSQFDRNQKNSGWMYMVNSSIPQVAAQDYTFTSNATMTWYFTDDYTKDYGSESWNSGGSSSGSSSDSKVTAVISQIAAIGTVTKDSGNAIEAARKAYDALTDAQKKQVTNYAVLTQAETAYAQLTNGNKTGFTDVASNLYYTDAVKWAVDQNITNGTSATTFSPDASCTRAQIVTFLWRAAGSPAPKSKTNPFTDVEEKAYYADAVLWAVENGITSGTSATTFSPDMVCTRSQSVTFMYRAAKATVTAGNRFTDVPTNAYYAPAVQWAVEKGVTSGTGSDRFSPNNNCTRGQIVTFLYRADQNK